MRRSRSSSAISGMIQPHSGIKLADQPRLHQHTCILAYSAHSGRTIRLRRRTEPTMRPNSRSTRFTELSTRMPWRNESGPCPSGHAAHPRRARAQGAVAGELDHPQRQPSAREHRRLEGRRPPGLFGLARHHHDRALFPCAAAAGPGGGQAACLAGVSRDPVSARPPDAGAAGAFPRLQGRAELSLAHQGCRRRRFLHRLGRPRRRADAVLLAGPGLRARAWLGGRTGRRAG